MTFRADRTDGRETQVVVRELLGGLDTKTPAHRVSPDSSPDLLNVTLSGKAVASRGGFVPAIKQRTKVCSLTNQGYRVESRAQRTAGAANTTYMTVPGCAHAGHRPLWDDADVRNGLTLDLFLRVGDLTTSHGGNSNSADPPYGPSPYTIYVRPILSKGPIKRTNNNGGEATGTTGWQTTSRWGPNGAGQHAMPFCLYLYNNSGTWQIRFSFHVWNATQWELVTVATSLGTFGGVKTDITYHVIAGYDIAQQSAFLRVGSLYDLGTYTYETTTIGFVGTAMPETTPTPIQLFDCPQEFVEAPATPSATRPPGLGLGSQADGAYWFAAKRFEGTVEDIVIWRGLVTNAATGALDRDGRINRDAPVATRLQHWPVESAQPDLLEEVSGLGNHLFFAPSDPIFDKSGGVDGGALVFNGTTSYALCEMSDNNPISDNWSDGRGGRSCWRTAFADGSTYKPGLWEYVVKHGFPHGLEVSFWPNSIEPNNEQVVAEAIGAARVVVTHDGYIKGYLRNSGAPAPGYTSVGTSLSRVVPGQRYHVILFRDQSNSGQLWVNGNLDSTATISNPSVVSAPVHGLVVGAGSINLGDSTNFEGGTGNAVAATLPADQVTMDHRTHFFGRVESLRVLVGSIPYSSIVGSAGLATAYKRALEDDYKLKYDRLGYKVAPTQMAGEHAHPSPDEPLPNFGAGHGLTLPQHQRGGFTPLGVTGLSNPARFDVHAAIDETTGGPPSVRSQLMRIARTVAVYDFSTPVPEYGYEGAYIRNLDFRDTHIHRLYSEDLLGYGGPVQLRCSESDPISETLVSVEYRHTCTPYIERSPRELAPQWDAGFLRPNLDEDPVTFVSDWRHETTGEQFQVVGSRRSIYWWKPVWRQQSPFGFGGGNSLWMSGHRDDYSYARLNDEDGGDWGLQSEVVDFWVYPTRMDGDRMVVMRGNPLSNAVRWAVLFRNGQLHVLGNLQGLLTWSWVQGTVLTSPTRNVAEVGIRLSQWNHVAIKIGDSEVKAWINGQRVTMTSGSQLYGTSAIDADAFDGHRDIWIGGCTADLNRRTWPIGGGAGSLSIPLLAWHGYISEVRQSQDLSDFAFSETTSGTVPTVRAVPSGVTQWLYRLNRLSGWEDEEATGNGEPLQARPTELIGVRHDLDDMQRVGAQTAVFRNRLLVVHPNIKPQAVSFVAFDADHQFVSYRLGVHGPGIGLFTYRSADVTQQGTGSTFSGGEVLEFYVSFVSYQAGGEESGTFSIGTFKLPALPSYGIEINGLPRSADPQVTARRLYLSVDGSGLVFVGELFDNTSTSFAIVTKEGFGLTSDDPRNRLPAPVARSIAVAPGVVALAATEDNPNVFALSGDSAGYFPLSRYVPIDSQDGRGIVGIIAQLNSVFLFKRNGTWAVSGVGVRPVNGSAGAGGGAATYDNVVFGCGDRGVWMFDGANYNYASSNLEGDFATIDVTENGLAAQRGTFFYPQSQYWLSVRRSGDQFNKDIYVLHTASGSNPGWTKVQVPPHLSMGLTNDPGFDRPSLMLGGSSGQVLRLDLEATTDGVEDHSRNVSTGTTGTDSVTIANPLFIHDMRGAIVRIYSDTGVLLLTTRITKNTKLIFWIDGTLTPGQTVTYVIGGFDSYWTSPWLDPQQNGSYLKVEALDLDFEPRVGKLRIDHAAAIRDASAAVTYETARTFDMVALGAKSQEIDMDSGYREQPPPITTRQQGRYFRFRFGTYATIDGPGARFSVTGYGLRHSSVGTKGGPT